MSKKEQKTTEEINDSVNNVNESYELKIKELETQLAEEKGAKLMALADFQNYKKRLENEKNDYRVFATKLIIGQLMQIIDDFGRTIDDTNANLAENQELASKITSNLKMIQDKIALVLTENGFEELKINVGDAFNAQTMEAITAVPASGDQKDNSVIHVDQRGYKHIDSGIVFKMAKVIVARKK